jgi:hypothetical protein
VRHVFPSTITSYKGGKGDRIADILAAASGAKLPRLQRFAVEGLPVCGSITDVLRKHGLDAWSLKQRAQGQLSTPRVQNEAFPNSFGADTGL